MYSGYLDAKGTTANPGCAATEAEYVSVSVFSGRGCVLSSASASCRTLFQTTHHRNVALTNALG